MLCVVRKQIWCNKMQIGTLISYYMHYESVHATDYNNRNKHNKVTAINEPNFVALEVTVKKNKKTKGARDCTRVYMCG